MIQVQKYEIQTYWLPINIGIVLTWCKKLHDIVSLQQRFNFDNDKPTADLSVSYQLKTSCLLIFEHNKVMEIAQKMLRC